MSGPGIMCSDWMLPFGVRPGRHAAAAGQSKLVASLAKPSVHVAQATRVDTQASICKKHAAICEAASRAYFCWRSSV